MTNDEVFEKRVSLLYKENVVQNYTHEHDE